MTSGSNKGKKARKTSNVRVVTVEVRAVVDGIKLGVHEASVMLGVDSIPSVVLSCAPSEGDMPAPLKPKVFKPTILDFSKLYRKLSMAAEGLDRTGDVYISVKYSDGTSDTLDLKGWILSVVGMSGISATSAPYLTVTLSHPICRLTKVGAIYEEAKTNVNETLNWAVKMDENLLHIMDSVYRCVREGVEIRYWEVEGLPESFRKSLGDGIYDPGRYLEFKTDDKEQGIFLGGAECAEDMRNRLSQAIGRMVLPKNGGGSTWDVLVGASGSMLLTITQDQDTNYTGNKLVLEPRKPWKKASLTLDQEHCAATEIPGMDPFKMSGVMARKLGPYTDQISLMVMRDGNANEQNPVTSEAYIPMSDPGPSRGRMMVTSAPMVLEAAFRRDAPHGNTIATANIDAEKTRIDFYNKAIKQYCKAVYEVSALSMVKARASMVLAFRDIYGNLILPGNTCVFKSGDYAIYYGYAQEVVHHWSTDGGCATTITMAYVRPEEDFKIGDKTVIAAGSPNAAYQK